METLHVWVDFRFLCLPVADEDLQLILSMVFYVLHLKKKKKGEMKIKYHPSHPPFLLC